MEVCVVIICVIILKLAAELPELRARKKLRNFRFIKGLWRIY